MASIIMPRRRDLQLWANSSPAYSTRTISMDKDIVMDMGRQFLEEEEEGN
jgi:hypothetical protein